MYAQEKRRQLRAEKRKKWMKENDKTLVVSGKGLNTLTLKSNHISRVVKAVDTETEYRQQINAEAAKYKVPDMPIGSTCIPEVAIYRAGFRTVRKGAVHFVK